jgi:hypothetical protein
MRQVAMIHRQASFRYLFAAALLFGLWGTAHAAAAAVGISTADLQAAAHALGFLETLPHDGIVVIGIVYSAGVPDQRVLAAKVAERLNVIPGPNSAHFRAKIISLDDPASFASRLDGLFPLPGALAPAARLAWTQSQQLVVNTTGNIGAMQMSALARTLQHACKQGQSETVERLVTEFSNASARVTVEVNDWIAARSVDDAPVLVSA